MKFLILGIDALEYDLVEEYDLKHLKQIEYGKVKVPITNTLEPATEVVWTSFITGKQPGEYGYSSPVLYKQPFKYLFRNRIIGSDTLVNKGKKRRLLDLGSSLMFKLGFFYHPTSKDIKVPTIFDNPNTEDFFIPVLDLHAFPFYRAKMTKVPREKIKKMIEGEIYARTDVLDYYLEFNKTWKIIMMYFFYIDAIQHLFFDKPYIILDYYLRLNEYVGKLKKKLSKDTALLIVSDHGQKRGIHTKYGFYSCNKKLGLKNPDITDFKEIIERKCGFVKNADILL